jgi:hypothetical protein
METSTKLNKVQPSVTKYLLYNNDKKGDLQIQTFINIITNTGEIHLRLARPVFLLVCDDSKKAQSSSPLSSMSFPLRVSLSHSQRPLVSTLYGTKS